MVLEHPESPAKNLAAALLALLAVLLLELLPRLWEPGLVLLLELLPRLQLLELLEPLARLQLLELFAKAFVANPHRAIFLSRRRRQQKLAAQAPD